MNLKKIMKKTKGNIEEKATNLQFNLASKAQMRYIHWLAKEEDCELDEAWAIVQGRTDPLEPEYMLGYKLEDPVLLMALFGQLKKENRIQAAKNFAATLTDPEREMFYEKIFNEETGQAFKDALKKAKKKGKKKKGKGLDEIDYD